MPNPSLKRHTAAENLNCRQLAHQIAELCFHFTQRYEWEAAQLQGKPKCSILEEASEFLPCPAEAAPCFINVEHSAQKMQCGESNAAELESDPLADAQGRQTSPDSNLVAVTNTLSNESEEYGEDDGEDAESVVLAAPFQLYRPWEQSDIHAASTMMARFCNRSMTGHFSGTFFVEEVRCIDRHHFVMNPSSKRRTLWNTLSVIALAYDVVAVPLNTGFAIDTTGSSTLEALDWIMRFFWTFDIGVNFLTGYFHKGEVVFSLRKIAVRYFKGWLIFDVAIVGMDWTFTVILGLGNQAARLPRLMKFARLARFMRMFRLLRVIRVTSALSVVVHYLLSELGTARLVVVKMLLMVMLFNHVIACCWYGIGDSVIKPNWIDAFHIRGESFGFRYALSYIWALTQVGVGNSTVVPTNEHEAFFAMAVMVSGIVMLSTCISAFTNSLANLQQKRSQESSRFYQLYEFYRTYGISSDLALRINKYVTFHQEGIQKRMNVSDVELLKEVSQPLQAEVHYSVYQHGLKDKDIFSRLCRWSRGFMRQVSFHAISSLLLAKGDLVFHRGSVATQTTGLLQGELKYTINLPPRRTTHWHAHLGETAMWACEAALWIPWVHLGSMHASRATEVLAVYAKKFSEITMSHPEVSDKVIKHARKFVSELNNELFGPEGDLIPNLMDAQYYDLN